MTNIFVTKHILELRAAWRAGHITTHEFLQALIADGTLLALDLFRDERELRQALPFAERVIVAGDTPSAVRMAVVHYMRNNDYLMPSYVHCPILAMPPSDVIQSWALRGVVILPHRHDNLAVWAT